MNEFLFSNVRLEPKDVIYIESDESKNTITLFFGKDIKAIEGFKTPEELNKRRLQLNRYMEKRR